MQVDAGTGYTLMEFRSGNKALFNTSCGKVDEKGWKVADGSCNFYTASTKVASAVESTHVKFRTTLRNNGTLDSRDFAWIFYYQNDMVVKTMTVRGDMAYPQITLEDSILVRGNDVIRMRISFICDKSDEEWLLPDEGLTIYIPSGSGEAETEQENVINTVALEVITDDEGNLITWGKDRSPQAAYYLVERSTDGNTFEFAGYVNTGISNGEQTVFHFRENRPGKAIYRVTGISSNGQKLDVMGTVNTAGGGMTAQSP
jgi:hypothetical protein